MDELKKQAEELGIKVDGRWSEERLQAEIDKVLGGEPLTEEVEEQAEEVVEQVVEEVAQENEVAGLPADDAGPSEPEEEDEEITGIFDLSAPVITNLRANANKRLGLKGFGSVTLTEAQLRDENLLKRIQHGIDTGVLSAE